ncbi:MAG: CHAT domain-containing protein, partial [Pseudomonadota bacterium]|nr:CHAT domain-containing protein [Pseudomonadota bacterium]
LAATALMNLARHGLPAEERHALLAEAAAGLDGLADSHDKAFALLGIGRALLAGADAGGPAARDQALAWQVLDRARAMAENLGDQRAAAYAYGYLGRLYQQRGRPQEALRLTSRAAFIAQQLQAPELLYLWHWQAGRLHKAMNDPEAALAAYRHAAYQLGQISAELLSSHRGSAFREVVGPLYLEWADLLLKSAARINDPAVTEMYLVDARNAVEQLKTVELQDYFLDECVVAAQARATGLDQLAARTAVLYPILLAERTELLLSVPGGIRQFTVPVTAAALTDEVRALRRRLERRTTHDYLPHARRLYDWLIRPLEAQLAAAGVDTLVIVPDGPLRTVPLAALHDGRQFLIQRYALATTPGLTLTDASPLPRQDARVLVNGLTEGVQGFPPLPAVSYELAAIREIFGPGTETVLENQSFNLENLERALTRRPYTIVHIASHGQFASDIRDSFLLTYRQRITMDRLEEYMQFRRFSEEPVELLTLSACQTAAGDDRAALGLAGVAIKAGARSALGTLWFINDQASSLLVADFYRFLQAPDATKARALQQAQLKLLAEPRYRHPVYWSPFLLIGNWL